MKAILEMNLYQTYKLLKQRALRRPYDLTSQEIYKTARTIFYDKTDKKNLLKKISIIIALEDDLPFGLRKYGTEMHEAIKADRYSIERPYEIRHRFEEQNKSGLIYVMTSLERPGETKLGATTLTMAKRCSAYQYKYGYAVKADNSLQVIKPFELEEIVSKKIQTHRVTGNTFGDSIEWYFLSAEEIWSIVINSVLERKLLLK